MATLLVRDEEVNPGGGLESDNRGYNRLVARRDRLRKLDVDLIQADTVGSGGCPEHVHARVSHANGHRISRRRAFGDDLSRNRRRLGRPQPGNPQGQDIARLGSHGSRNNGRIGDGGVVWIARRNAIMSGAN